MGNVKQIQTQILKYQEKRSVIMNSLQIIEQEKRVLRWGGLSGMLGGFLFMLVWVVVGVFVGEDPDTLEGWVARFPEIQAARVVENLIYLVALILEVPLFLALYRALRRTSLAPALFGSAVGILGLVAMVVSTTPHVAHARISAIYFAAETTPADQATIILMWQAIWGMIDMMLYIGFFVVPIGLFVLGMGMFSAPAFGKVIGGVSMVLGAAGIVAAILQMIDPASMIGAVTYFACLIFYLVVGWKLFSLSRGPSEVLESQMVQPASMEAISP